MRPEKPCTRRPSHRPLTQLTSLTQVQTRDIETSGWRDRLTSGDTRLKCQSCDESCVLQQFQKIKRTSSDCLEALGNRRQPKSPSGPRGPGQTWIVEVMWATEIDCCLTKGSKTSLQKHLLLRQSTHHSWHCMPIHSNTLIPISSRLPPKTTLSLHVSRSPSGEAHFFSPKSSSRASCSSTDLQTIQIYSV